MKVILSVVTLVVMMTTMSSKAQAAQCEVELINGRGMTLEVFRGHGYDRIDACQEATQDCRRVIRSGYYRARVLNCEISRRQQNRMVHRSCSAEMVGPRGRTIQSFLAQASGPQGTGVKAQACQRAIRQCNLAKQRAGRIHAVCISENRTGGGYNRPIPPRRPQPVPVPPRRGGGRGRGI